MPQSHTTQQSSLKRVSYWERPRRGRYLCLGKKPQRPEQETDFIQGFLGTEFSRVEIGRFLSSGIGGFWWVFKPRSGLRPFTLHKQLLKSSSKKDFQWKTNEQTIQTHLTGEDKGRGNKLSDGCPVSFHGESKTEARRPHCRLMTDEVNKLGDRAAPEGSCCPHRGSVFGSQPPFPHIYIWERLYICIYI